MSKELILDMLKIQLADYQSEQYKHTIFTKEYYHFGGKISAILDIIDRINIMN